MTNTETWFRVQGGRCNTGVRVLPMTNIDLRPRRGQDRRRLRPDTEHAACWPWVASKALTGAVTNP